MKRAECLAPGRRMRNPRRTCTGHNIAVISGLQVYQWTSTCPDPNVLVRWEWPTNITSSPHIGPYSITTALALASKEWARAQLEANTFEREDYRELTASIYFYLGGDVSPHEPVLTDTALGDDGVGADVRGAGDVSRPLPPH